MTSENPPQSAVDPSWSNETHPLSSHLPADILIQLLAAAKTKPRSTETHDNVHLPALKALSGSISCLLLGCSMFERFKTTGRHTAFGPIPYFRSAPLPSRPLVSYPDDGAEIAAGALQTTFNSTCTSDTTNDSASIYPDPSTIPSYNPSIGIFNAGCGGDSLKNVIHRLTKTQPTGLLSLLLSLPSPPAHYIILQVGTNDLGDGKKPLSASVLSQYRLVLATLGYLYPRTKLCVCGLNPKKRVKKAGVIEESNAGLLAMVKDANEEFEKLGRMGVDFLPSDPKIINHLEEDGVHLNEVGYEIMAATLWARYSDMKARCDPFVNGATDEIPISIASMDLDPEPLKP